jgi:hypothetical protein
MRVDKRARVTYAAATPAVRKVSGTRQHPTTIADNAKALGYLLLGSRAHVKTHFNVLLREHTRS